MPKSTSSDGADASLQLLKLLTTAHDDSSAFADCELVHSVTRALTLLTAFDGGEPHLSLAELAQRTGLQKPTVLRLARTLGAARFLTRRSDGTWRLGPAAGWIGSRYQAQFDVDATIEPILRNLSAATGESASFFVFEGNLRSCLMRCEGPEVVHRHIRMGEVFPLDRGSAGHVILAALGEPGNLYEKIRRQGFSQSRGELRVDIASVSAAVRGRHGAVLGSVSTSGPIERLTEKVLQRHAPVTVEAARQLGLALGAVPVTAFRATWHPSA